ncbi:MAG: SDR family oxidoreductase [Pseudomonas sp.]
MKKVLIVGATSAIATACARLWAAEGAELFLVGRNTEQLQLIAADLRVRGATRVENHELDLNHFNAHEAMLQACFELFGALDVALVAHGTLPDQQACERDVDLALQEFASNGLSVIALLTRLANRFEAQGHGSLAVISSVAGDRGRPSNYLYGSAKAAVSAFCEGLRARLFKAGVHLLTIKPGFVRTPMTQGLALPELLLAEPEVVAGDILRSIERRASVRYTPWFWWPIMQVIKSVPVLLFKRLSL